MGSNSALTRARTWVLLIGGTLVILGALFGYISNHTDKKLETVDLRIETVKDDVRDWGTEIVKQRQDFGEVRERLARIEAHQETMNDKQDRILDAIERLRDD